MAKAKEEDKKTTAKRSPPQLEKPDYGIDELAKAVGDDDKANTRAKLRSLGDEVSDKYKKGRVWDFGSQKNVLSVAAQIKSKPKAEPAAKKAPAKDAKKAKDEKPAKKPGKK